MTTMPAPRPRITPSAYVAGAVVTVSVVLGVAVLSSPTVLAAALAAIVLILAWGWAGTLNLPTPRGTVGTVALGGLALVAAVGTRTTGPWLVWMPAALSLAMIAAFAHQVFRSDGRPRVVQSVSAVVLGLGVLACGVLLVPPANTPEGVALVLGALAAATASSLTDLLGRWQALDPWLSALAMLGGGAAAVLLSFYLGVPWTTWLLLGVASGALSHAMRATLADLPTMAHARPRLVCALASVLIVGIVPYLIAVVFVSTALPT